MPAIDYWPYFINMDGHSELPKDTRTLWETPRVVNVPNKCGSFWHQEMFGDGRIM